MTLFYIYKYVFSVTETRDKGWHRKLKREQNLKVLFQILIPVVQ